MSGNRSKKKKKTSNEKNSELDPLISFNGMNRPVVTQESGSTSPAHRPHSSTSLPAFRPVVTQESGSTPPARRPHSFRPVVTQESGYTPPAHRPHSSTSLPAFRPVVTQESSTTPPAYQPPSTSLLALRSATFQPPAYQPPAYQPPAYQTSVYQTPAYQPHIPLSQSALFTDHGHFMEMLGTFLPRPQQQQPQEQQQEQPQEQQCQQQPQLQQQPQEHQQQQQPQLQQQPQEHQQQQPQLQHQPQQGEENQIVIHPRRKYNKEVKLLRGKVLVRPAGLGLEPNREAAYAIKKAIMAVYKKFYPTYAKLIEDKDVKKEIFEAFSSLCTWEPHLRDDVESSFHHTAEERLKDLLYDARKAYEVKKNTPKDPYRPGWIGREVWNQLLHYWENDPHFKNRSAANKRNRSKGGSLHTHGSSSLFAHAQDMVQNNGGDIDIAKVHKETHLRKKTGGYVDLRSETTQYLQVVEFRDRVKWSPL